MKVREERRAEKEWKRQEIWERRREENRQRAMEERKCFVCRNFVHIAYHCRNMEEEESVQMPSNRFEVLKDRVIQRGKGSGSKVGVTNFIQLVPSQQVDRFSQTKLC